MAQRIGISEIKTAVTRKLRTDFNHTTVTGLTQDPLIIQDRPINSVDEPYVYIYEEDTIEVQKTKNSSSTDYFIIAQVVVRTTQSDDANVIRDGIVDEITRIVDTDEDNYIQIDNQGYNVYIQNVDSVTAFGPYDEDGATYFQANMTLQFRADFIGVPSTRNPIQAPIYTFADFTFPPTSNRVEVSDAGTITGATTYASANQGWDYVSVMYALISGGQGSLTDNVLTVGAADSPLGLTSTINYRFSSDNTITTSLTANTNFRRIRSLRFGSTTNTSFSAAELANLANFQGTNRTFRYGVENPSGQQISLEGNAGERFYIIFDNTHTINTITDVLGGNNRGAFTLTTVNGYSILLQTNPLVFNTSRPIQYTLS